MQNYIRFSLTIFPPPGNSHMLGQGISSLSSRKIVKTLSPQIKAILQPWKSILLSNNSMIFTLFYDNNYSLGKYELAFFNHLLTLCIPVCLPSTMFFSKINGKFIIHIICDIAKIRRIFLKT